VVRVLRLASQEVVVLALVEDGGVFGHAAFSDVVCIVYLAELYARDAGA
jgi:hypothetical protein